MSSRSTSVKVYIYDLSRGLARSMSQAFLGKQIDGIWHTGIVVFGKEYYFGGPPSGIAFCQPGGTIMGQPDSICNLGETEIPYDMFMDYLSDLSKTSFRPECYHLLNHNCNTFSSELAQFLTGNDIPAHITSLPAEVLSTPFGQMIKPFIDSMSVNPSGGEAVFHQGQTTCTTTPASKVQGSSHSGHSHSTESASSQSKHATTGPSVALKPAVFKEPPPDESVWSKPEFSLSSAQQSHMKEAYEYLSSTDDSWSLGRDHMNTLFILALQKDTPCKLCALQLLSSLVLKEHILQMMSHDKSSKLPDLLHSVDTANDSIRTAVMKMLTNMCSTSVGHSLLLRERTEKLLVVCCVTCMTGDIETEVLNTALACTYNLTLIKLSEDVALEIGSALLNCVDKVDQEGPGYHLLAAIYQLIKTYEEVRGLAAVLGLSFDVLQGKSDRLKQLTNDIQTLL